MPANPFATPDSGTVATLEPAQSWRVVVLDDPVNLMDYVVMVFRKTLGFNEETARRHMLEVHNSGRSTVWHGSREGAENTAFALQQWHLSAIIEPDENY
ncbi:MAG: ATP-dependent Clp protease adaptor ClpS [Opitutaceae bacterium]|jgi:ATP-dependent Clp protease adaptor protein ClpS|nr:ATP-dependent Clp protease adaptor ClpS [Opitutaceae bacterium]